MRFTKLVKVASFLMILLSLAGQLRAEDDEVASTIQSSDTAYFQLKPTITTNYISPKLKYVRTDVAIRVASSMSTIVEQHKDAIRDIMIMLLARQEKEVLTSNEGLKSLRTEAVAEITAFLESEDAPTDVHDVLFMSFLVE